MPSIITHCLSAKSVCQSLDGIDWPSLYFGAQGPDFFYYYHQLPWKTDDDEVREFQAFGDLFHHEHTNDWLLYFCQQKDYALKSYGLGLLCHFALDAQLHPFIFYFTEQHPQNKMGYIHRLFESHLERIVIDYVQQAITPKDYFLLSSQEQQVIAKEYVALLEKWGWSCDEKKVEEAMTECQMIHRLLNNSWSIQEKALNMLEEKSHQCIQAKSLVIPQKADRFEKFIQNNNMTWCHPVTGELRSETIIDLFDQAQEEARTLVDLAYHHQWDALKEKINHRNLDTGLSATMPMQYFYHSSR